MRFASIVPQLGTSREVAMCVQHGHSEEGGGANPSKWPLLVTERVCARISVLMLARFAVGSHTVKSVGSRQYA
jgi:hypothetical protein